MTVAVCFLCGAFKKGSFINCENCGVRPENEDEITYSMALTDHYFTLDVLSRISSAMIDGAPHPLLPVEQEDVLRRAAQEHIIRFGESLGLPPPDNDDLLIKSSIFRGWPDKLNLSISQLRWRAGFGWMAVALMVMFAMLSIVFDGYLRIPFIFVLVVLLIFNIYRFSEYSRKGWRRLHSRAMLIHSMCAGLEAGAAQRENRKPDASRACMMLAAIMLKGPWSTAKSIALVDRLSVERGRYFLNLLMSLDGNVTNIDIDSVIEIASKEEQLNFFGPKLVICKIIENTYGKIEATKYLLAIISGKAK